MKKGMIVVVTAVVLGLLVPAHQSPVSLANDDGIAIEAGKECGCPAGWVVVAGGSQCLNTRTEEIIPYCRSTDANV